jgi:hypothetical protein
MIVSPNTNQVFKNHGGNASKGSHPRRHAQVGDQRAQPRGLTRGTQQGQLDLVHANHVVAVETCWLHATVYGHVGNQMVPVFWLQKLNDQSWTADEKQCIEFRPRASEFGDSHPYLCWHSDDHNFTRCQRGSNACNSSLTFHICVPIVCSFHSSCPGRFTSRWTQIVTWCIVFPVFLHFCFTTYFTILAL